MDLKEMGWEGVECIDLARGQEWTHVAHGRDKWQSLMGVITGSIVVRGIS
jgi:hypothetical protein